MFCIQKPAARGLLFVAVFLFASSAVFALECPLPDIVARWDAPGEHALVTHVRPGSHAARLGVRDGARVMSIDQKPTAQIRANFSNLECEAWPNTSNADAALLEALSFRGVASRALTVENLDGTRRTIWLPHTDATRAKAGVRRYENVSLIVRVVSLDGAARAKLLRSVRAAVSKRETQALLIDLRDTSDATSDDSEAWAQSLRTFSQPIAFIVSPWTCASLVSHLQRDPSARIIGTRANAPPSSAGNVIVPARTDYGTDAVFSTALNVLNIIRSRAR